MEKIANELVQCRRNNPSEKKDLLNAMIKGKDPKSDEKMRDDLIISNMIIFLIAGHETTSNCEREGSSPSEGLSEVLILFGSNTGTCQVLAQRLLVATDAGKFGYKGKVRDMDSSIPNLQKAKIAVIITASYEGQPPDNAVQFVEWVTSKARNLNLDFSQYEVFVGLRPQ